MDEKGPTVSLNSMARARNLSYREYEYFHGDNGAGPGASHQTGWTGLVVLLLDLFGRLDAKTTLETARGKAVKRLFREQVAGEQTGGK